MTRFIVLLTAFILSFSVVFGQSTEERLRLLEEKLEEMEVENSFQNFKISGTFIQHAETINQQIELDNGLKQNNRGDVLALHVALNIDFHIHEKLDFFTSLGMGKLWNNDGREGQPQEAYHSNEGSYGYTGSEVKMDVAYLRVKTSHDPLTFALGRMTTRGGPPMNQLDVLNRSGTYPRFAYNAIFDGVAAVYSFDHLLPENVKFKTRLFYTPYYVIDKEDRMQPQRDTKNKVKVDRRSDQLALLNELTLKKTSLAEEINIFSMAWYYDNFYEEEFQNVDTPGPDYYRALSHTLYLGLERVFNTGLNTSLSVLNVKDDFTGVGSDNSTSYLANLNYAWDRLALGVEYIKTDYSFYLDDFTYLHFNEFYLRGNNEGVHLFSSYVLTPNQRLRIGVYDYAGGKAVNQTLQSDPQSTETDPEMSEYSDRVQNFYLSYRVDF